MLGVSLPFKALTDGTGLGSDAFLDELFAKDVRSIELRAVMADENPDAVITAARRVWRHGLRVSIHTAPRCAATAENDIFMPLRDVLKAEKQDNMILVLHPVNGDDLYSDNIRMLDTLANRLCMDNICASLALENNRLMPDRSNGDSADFVMRLIGNADPAYAGLCLDFGHFAWASRSWETEAPVMPPKQFTDMVIHTHIHALYPTEKGYTTHFPLHIGSLPLKEYISAIGKDYGGVYNLELEPRRFEALMDGRTGIFGSLDVLRGM